MSISRGFRGRRQVHADPGRVPPGQYVTTDFPVLSAGPTPHTPLAEWSFTIRGAVDQPVTWTWDELRALPSETPTVDIHCVTKWSKLDTAWRGVSLDTLLEPSRRAPSTCSPSATAATRPTFRSRTSPAARPGSRTSSTGEPLDPEHGGPARLLVPHLYFWKSAKWVRGLELREDDEPGFWEDYGYHNYGDPWKEQRYAGD